MTNVNELRDEKTGKLPSYAWPGGYPVFYLMDDCETLCPACANDPKNPIHTDSTQTNVAKSSHLVRPDPDTNSL